jgi:hypothetical protein
LRTSTLAACFVTLCAIAAPVHADPQPNPVVHREPGPKRQAASPEQLERYAERESQAREQQRFEGGHMRNGDLVTIILVLVIVILVLAIVR